MVDLLIIKQTCVAAFGFMLGMTLFFIMCAIFTTILCGSGYYVIKKYNKKSNNQETKLLQEIQIQQYFGFFLIFIGILPYLNTILRGVFFNLGGNIGESIYNEL